MSDSLHIVCPHCHTTNRVPADKLAAHGNCGRCKQPLFDGHPATLTEANYARHLEQSDIPVVVDFWAPWCGPCKIFAPVFERAAAQLEPRVRLAKIDTQTEHALAARFGIRSIPTLAIYHHGREIARQAGAMNLNGFVRWVESVL